MAFEIAHPQLRFEALSPAQRLLALLAGLAFVVGLAWACVTAYQAEPLAPSPPAKPLITPGAGSRGA
jgi:hypothetical protein